MSFTVACWFRYLNGRDEQGREIVMRDPMAPRLRAIAQAAGRGPSPMLALREMFSEEIAASPEFVGQVRGFLENFYERGARATLAEALSKV